jgi:hypothetical protein
MSKSRVKTAVTSGTIRAELLMRLKVGHVRTESAVKHFRASTTHGVRRQSERNRQTPERPLVRDISVAGHTAK